MKTPDTGSSLWWLLMLDEKRRDRNRELAALQAYASGDHPLPEGAKHWREYYRRWQKRARTNLCGLAASAVSERLKVEGFRSGELGNPAVDQTLWTWWNRNRMNAHSRAVHDAMAELGVAYVLVGPGDLQVPRLSAESPFQVIVEKYPGDDRIQAALKVWDGPIAGLRHARVYLPGEVCSFVAELPKYDSRRDDLDWQEVGSTPNRLGEVPVVEFVNRPKLTGGGLSEFADAIDVQDRLNSNQLHLLTIAQSQAFRQRWVKGLPTEDEDGNPLDPPFEALVSALWSVEDTAVEFGEFAQADIRPILESIKADISVFVMLTGLPPHYVQGDMVNASAEAFAAAESRLVAKVESRMTIAGEAWEQAIHLAGRWAGSEVPLDLQVLWADPERKTESQRADAALKDLQSGVPWETRMERRGFSPTQIARMKQQRAEEAELQAMQATATARLAIDGPVMDEGSGELG